MAFSRLFTSIRSKASIPSLIVYSVILEHSSISKNPFSHQLRTMHLEVERKFAPTAISLALLRTNSGPTPFNNFKALPTVEIKDKYYDDASKLLDKGIYIRNRNGIWEAKVRMGGGYINSQFRELKGENEVAELVAREIGKGLNELNVLAGFVTRREKWNAEGFTICVDELDFEAPLVGEVELECDVRDGENKMKEMDRRIDEFMRKYEWAFPRGTVKGKLTLYFDKVMSDMGREKGVEN